MSELTYNVIPNSVLLAKSKVQRTPWKEAESYIYHDEKPLKTMKRKKIESKVSAIRRNLITTFFFMLSFGELVTAAPSRVGISRQYLRMAEIEELAYQWAPLVWLHPNEHHYPSSVVDFLQHVKVSKPTRGNALTIEKGDTVITLPPLPEGRASWDAYLLSSYNPECQNCQLPTYLYGKKPGRKHSPPVYAVIHSCNSLQQNREGNDLIIDDEGFLNDERNWFLNDDTGSNEEYPYIIEENSNNPNEKDFTPQGNQTTREIINDKTNSPGTSSLKVTGPPQSNGQWYIHNDFQNNFQVSEMHREIMKESSEKRPVHPTASVNISFGTNTIPIKTTATPPNLIQSTLQDRIDTDNHTASKLLFEAYNQNSNIQNDQDNYKHQNTVPDPSMETVHTFTVTEKKHDVIFNSNYIFSITYWMFYPYNYAKEICTSNLGIFGRILKPTIGGVCHGEKIPMGNHIGDWEHITIQFKGRTPTKLYISSHNFGAFYTYDARRHWFHYMSHDTREGVPLSPNYPLTLQIQGTHAIVYSALGSHGLWAAPGIHQYNGFPHLEDKTGRGTAWETWQNLDIIDLQSQEKLNSVQKQWLSYEGRWGNPSSRCHALMGGFCEINDGPTGIPRKRINFPCPR